MNHKDVQNIFGREILLFKKIIGSIHELNRQLDMNNSQNISEKEGGTEEHMKYLSKLLE